jgi:hypothetical protein
LTPIGLRFSRRELAWAWLVATALSGAPSTLWALATGSDIGEATWAAGAMLIPADSPQPALFAAAGLVHGTVSAFWTLVAGALLPRRHTTWWALLLAASIGALDLRLIAPAFFPSVAALAFWPQMADHLMWGACLGGTLQWLAAHQDGLA